MFDFTHADNGSDLLLTCDVFIEVAPVLMIKVQGMPNTKKRL